VYHAFTQRNKLHDYPSSKQLQMQAQAICGLRRAETHLALGLDAAAIAWGCSRRFDLDLFVQ